MVEMCEYKFRNGEICKEEALPNSKYCILHIDLPEYDLEIADDDLPGLFQLAFPERAAQQAAALERKAEQTFINNSRRAEDATNAFDNLKSEEFEKINELKEEKVKEKISKGDFNFEGAKLLKIDFSRMEIEGDVNFKDVVIIRDASFIEAKIDGFVSFIEAKIGGKAWFREAKIGGYVWFYEAKIGGEAWFSEAKIDGFASFDKAEIGGDASFDKAEIGGFASFDKAEIGGDASFNEAKIGKGASFDKAEIGGNTWFNEAEIGGFASFNEAKIGKDASFNEAKIGKGASFDKAEIGGNTWFNEAEIGGFASFNEAKIGKDASFDLLEIKGKLSFRDAIFKRPEAQEESCRKAKRIWEEIGDRIEVDYYFYREMEAKRQQKHPIIRFLLELPVQYIFGYGVHPWRVIATWFITVFSLAFVYWYGNGIIIEGDVLWWERIIPSIYFSIVTAATPGYGGYKPASGFYLGLASFEAIFGTFMWAAFIATFARKYMR